jgi:hypothetical protein
MGTGTGDAVGLAVGTDVATGVGVVAERVGAADGDCAGIAVAVEVPGEAVGGMGVAVGATGVAFAPQPVTTDRTRMRIGVPARMACAPHVRTG